VSCGQVSEVCSREICVLFHQVLSYCCYRIAQCLLLWVEGFLRADRIPSSVKFVDHFIGAVNPSNSDGVVLRIDLRSTEADENGSSGRARRPVQHWNLFRGSVWPEDAWKNR
jgi:hypothetical protein